jgi:hypothetical protein
MSTVLSFNGLATYVSHSVDISLEKEKNFVYFLLSKFLNQNKLLHFHKSFI